MRKFLKLGLLFLALTLNYTALDDITTGNEPNYSWEYTIIALTILSAGLFFFRKKLSINSK